MDDERKKIKRLPIYSISPEAKVVYDKLAPNIQEMYRTETCVICAAHLPVKQLNNVIVKGVPPVCQKCLNKMQEDMEKLKPLFGQLGLF